VPSKGGDGPSAPPDPTLSAAMNVWSTAAGIPPGGKGAKGKSKQRSVSGPVGGSLAGGGASQGAPLPRGAPPAQPLPAGRPTGGRGAGGRGAGGQGYPKGAQPPPPPPPGAQPPPPPGAAGQPPLPQGAMQPVNVMTPTTKLHEEVVSYANRNLAACESSHTEVNQIMIRMRNIVDKLWSGARPEMYGSRSTGLYLATSDVDVVLTGLPMPTSPSDAKRSVPG